MPFRLSPQSQRRFCGVMLLLWLFAVLSGTVNACMLADNARTGQAAEHVHGDHDLAHHEHHDGQAPLADDTAPHHADEHLACHKFCQDEARTLPPGKYQDGLDFTPVLQLHGSPLLPEVTPTLPVVQATQGPPAHGPPLVIRLLRLAL